MNPNDPNIQAIQLVTSRLGNELCEQMVFVGGAIVGLLITDPAMPDIRATKDVDLVCEIVTRTEYQGIESALRERGFTQTMHEDDPICRWRIDGAIVDVMPPQENILGFTNRWYPLALQSPQHTTLPDNQPIRVITAPVFIATKLEAFAGRGDGDYLFSHDIEDIIAVVDGRDSLISECQNNSSGELKEYLVDQFTLLLSTPAFTEALSGHLPPDPGSQQRLPDLIDKLNCLTQL